MLGDKEVKKFLLHDVTQASQSAEREKLEKFLAEPSGKAEREKLEKFLLHVVTQASLRAERKKLKTIAESLNHPLERQIRLSRTSEQ